MDYLDMLARLGAGSAHPGGFGATLQQLEYFPLPAGSEVLEVGCGTGRTACLLAERGIRVTGADIRPEMIAKAERRAEAMGAQVIFQVADACRLPYKDESFDAVLVESVTVFTEVRRALREYFRVLKPGGMLYDRENMALLPMPGPVGEEFNRVHGIAGIPASVEWLRLARAAGFQGTAVWGPFPLPPAWEDALRYPDPQQTVNTAVYEDPDLWQAALDYGQKAGRYTDYLGWGLLAGAKPSAAQ